MLLADLYLTPEDDSINVYRTLGWTIGAFFVGLATLFMTYVIARSVKNSTDESNRRTEELFKESRKPDLHRSMRAADATYDELKDLRELARKWYADDPKELALVDDLYFTNLQVPLPDAAQQEELSPKVLRRVAATLPRRFDKSSLYGVFNGTEKFMLGRRKDGQTIPESVAYLTTQYIIGRLERPGDILARTLKFPKVMTAAPVEARTSALWLLADQPSQIRDLSPRVYLDTLAAVVDILAKSDDLGSEDVANLALSAEAKLLTLDRIRERSNVIGWQMPQLSLLALQLTSLVLCSHVESSSPAWESMSKAFFDLGELVRDSACFSSQLQLEAKNLASVVIATYDNLDNTDIRRTSTADFVETHVRPIG